MTEELITLKVARDATESLFLLRVIQAAIQVYRNGSGASEKCSIEKVVSASDAASRIPE
jgi:hypothetical protein